MKRMTKRTIMIAIGFLAVAMGANGQRIIRSSGRTTIDTIKCVISANTNLIRYSSSNGSVGRFERVYIYPDSLVWSYRFRSILDLRDVIEYDREVFLSLINSIAERPFDALVKKYPRGIVGAGSETLYFGTTDNRDLTIGNMFYGEEGESSRIFRLVNAFMKDHMTEGERTLKEFGSVTSINKTNFPEELKPYRVKK